MMTEEQSASVASEARRALSARRSINIMWETTQALIAMGLVGAAIIIWVYGGLKGLNIALPETLSNSLFLVIGFYFGRTNHARPGVAVPGGLPPAVAVAIALILI